MTTASWQLMLKVAATAVWCNNSSVSSRAVTKTATNKQNLKKMQQAMGSDGNSELKHQQHW